MIDTAVIVAAGMGRRLAEISNGLPKCLIEINGKKIIDYSLSALRRAGIKKLIVVVGYRHEEIERYIGKNAKYIVNENFAITNNLYSLWLGAQKAKNGFVYLHSDILYHPGIIERLLKTDGEFCLVVEQKKTVPEEMKITVKDGKMIFMGKEIAVEEAYGEWLGITKFSNKGRKIILEESQKILEDKNKWMDYDATLFNKLAHEGREVKVVDVDELPWIEIDFPEDFERAKKDILPKINHLGDVA